MQNYNKNLKIWAKFAMSLSEEDTHTWTHECEKLSREELEEMLGILAGYFGATPEGRKLLEGWAKKT